MIDRQEIDRCYDKVEERPTYEDIEEAMNDAAPKDAADVAVGLHIYR